MSPFREWCALSRYTRTAPWDEEHIPCSAQSPSNTAQLDASMRSVPPLARSAEGASACRRTNAGQPSNCGVDDHHIFPKAYVARSKQEGPVDSILNRTLIDRLTNITISAKAPSSYLQQMAKAMQSDVVTSILKSHHIPIHGAGAPTEDDFPAFVSARLEVLEALLVGAIGRPLLPEEPSAALRQDTSRSESRGTISGCVSTGSSYRPSPGCWRSSTSRSSDAPANRKRLPSPLDRDRHLGRVHVPHRTRGDPLTDRDRGPSGSNLQPDDQVMTGAAATPAGWPALSSQSAAQ